MVSCSHPSVFLLCLFFLIVELPRNEAKRERNKKCDSCRKASQKYSAFPGLYLILLVTVLSLPYFLIADFFFINQTVAIFFRSRSSTFTSWFQHPSFPHFSKRAAMLSSIRFPVCKRPKVIENGIISKLHAKIKHTTLHGLIIVYICYATTLLYYYINLCFLYS